MPTLPPKALIAFNKMDQVGSETLALAQQHYPEALFISATQRLGLETLKQHLIQLVVADVNKPLVSEASH